MAFQAAEVIRADEEQMEKGRQEEARRKKEAERSSCENDWKTGGTAEATYATWMGHSAKVSREHYVAPTDAEFEAVTAAA